ncbi:FAD/NAD(P)-binding domain-containing protein, partial [Auricularia subglabra TFB-10046 SS5]
RIAIIGAGPIGRNNVPAILYERDEEFGSRAHLGGTLDLSPETGQAAIKAAGVWDAFVAHSRPEGMQVLVTDRTGEPLFHWAPSPETKKTAHPEIDRRLLRRIIVDGAPAGSIKWGHALSSVAPGPETKEWELTFANGFKTVVDLVVGADGGRSSVRPLVSDAEVQYTCITGVEVSFETAKHPELAARVGHGSVYAYDDYKSITAQRTGDGRVRIYALDEEAFARLYATEGPERMMEHTLSYFGDWAPWLCELVAVADRNAVYPRSLYMLPVGHTWVHRAGVTLTGDAMNLMTPFAGRGANIAMSGAMQLGLAL